MLKTTLKSIRGNLGRLLATAFAVILGIAFLAGTLIFTNSIGAAFDDIFGSAFENTDAQIRSAETIEVGFGFPPSRAPIDENLIELASAVDGVAAASGVVDGIATIIGADGEPIGSPGQGPPTVGQSWVDDPELNPYSLIEGRAPEGPGEVAIDDASAAAGGFSLGDQVQVLTAAGSESFELVGTVRLGTASAALGGATFTLWELSESQRVLALEGEINSVLVRGDEGLTSDEVVARLWTAMPLGLEVISGVQAAEEQRGDVEANLRFIDIFLVIFAAIAVFVAAFVIFNTFSILVAQRTREFGLLRAIGASRRQLMWSMFLESLFVGVVGSLLGLVAGIGLAYGLRGLLRLIGADLPTSSMLPTSSTVVVSLLLGTLVTVAGALLPAVQASRVSPMEALRESVAEPWERNRLRFVLGALILSAGAAAIVFGLFQADVLLAGVGAAAMFLGVLVLGPSIARPVARVLGWPLARVGGVSGRMARDNAMRNPARTARTAAALSIGVALVAAIGILASSLRATIENTIAEQFIGDIVVDSGAFRPDGGFSPELTRQVAELPEVDQLTPVRVSLVTIAGVGDFALGVDPEAAVDILDFGVIEGDAATVAPNEIMLLDKQAELFGVGLGDQMIVGFLGAAPQALTVSAIFTNEEFGGRQVLHIDLLDEMTASPLDFAAYMTVTEGVTIDEARTAIERVTEAYPIAAVQDRAQFTEAQTASFDPVLGLIFALLGLAIVIAAFGIANTLRLSAIERTREIGLLRAVGATREQIRQSMSAEAAITSVFGSLLGVTLGVFLGYALVTALREQFPIVLYIPAVLLVLVVVMGAIVGLLASVLPAIKASNLNVLEAIATE